MSQFSVEAVFNAALAKGSPGERCAFLDGACGDNADLRARIETLLRAHDEAGDFLALPETEAGSSAEGSGQTIGRYKLLQKIGEGGFGVVYMAEQQQPVHRKVALKIIKLGMDTRQVVARFESERQALAMMDHPNIARVLDAGATDSGRPYFVMELVRGIPITEFCDQNNQTPRERLALFKPVCQAIQHAHHKGIIHRDLKPSNVLVTLHDGTPVPKVIDFGIAKATNQRLTEKTLFTEFRQFIGTPQYMSPEQAEMSGLDIDTRSDIYSLGVLLYELLTGTTPFDANTLREVSYVEMQRIIREEDPPSPSVRISTLHDQVTDIAKRRGSEPEHLRGLIRGDMDWIVMKAMEKDRTRRYETANGMAADIQRHLDCQPVLAGPPSVLYRVRKFVRRNRVGVTTAAIVAVALFLGLGAASIGFIEAHREASRSQAIADFLQEILASSDPEEAAGRNLDVKQVSERARELFGDDHATVATTLNSLAVQLQNSGDLDAAEPLYRESVAIWRNLYGDDHNSDSASSWNPQPSLDMLERFTVRILLSSGLPAEHYQAAKLGADTLLAEERDGVSPVCLMGMVQYRLGDLHDARKHLSEACGQVDSESVRFVQARAFLAMTLSKLGEQHQAERMIAALDALTLRDEYTGTDTRSLVIEAATLITPKRDRANS